MASPPVPEYWGYIGTSTAQGGGRFKDRKPIGEVKR